MGGIGDIGRSIPVDGVYMTIRHPGTGQDFYHDGNPSRIRVIGKDTKAYRDLKSTIHGKYKKSKNESFHSIESIECEILARSVTAVDNFYYDEEHGVIEYDFKLMFDILLAPTNLWLKEQINAFMEDRSNFLPEEPVTSDTTSSV